MLCVRDAAIQVQKSTDGIRLYECDLCQNKTAVESDYNKLNKEGFFSVAHPFRLLLRIAIPFGIYILFRMIYIASTQ